MTLAEKQILDTHIASHRVLLTPAEMKERIPLSENCENTVLAGRSAIGAILDGSDKRRFLVMGPCSIHDPKAALEYATKLKSLSDQVKDKLLIIMRVYFEKPRTTVGWKGFINDPHMDESFAIEEGLLQARQLLVQIAEMGLPVGTEALDPISPQYISSLVCWSAIGARTIESQTHREMASGLSMPVGLKNGTDGNIQVAVDALEASRNPHHFLGMNNQGQVSLFQTKGNNYGHIILRGGGGQPNYQKPHIDAVKAKLSSRKLPSNLVVDCSHGNSNKDHTRQGVVFHHVIQQIIEGETAIVGMMLESHLKAGNQKIPKDLTQLEYGVSITDKCIGWEESKDLILDAYEKL